MEKKKKITDTRQTSTEMTRQPRALLQSAVAVWTRSRNDSAVTVSVGTTARQDPATCVKTGLSAWAYTVWAPYARSENMRAHQRHHTHPHVGQLQPQHKHGLERIVPRHIVENESRRNALRKVEKAKDDPVGEPLDVILCAGELKGFKGEVGGEGPSDKVGDWCGEGVDKVEESDEEDSANG